MRKTKKYMAIVILITMVVHSRVEALWINNQEYFVEDTEIVDKKIQEVYDYLTIDVEIPQINGIKDEKAEKVINNNILDYTNMWISEVKSIAEEYFGYPIKEKPSFPYQLFSRYKVTHNNRILSMYIDYYQFTGGAHGITERATYNIDVDSGKIIELGNLFKKDYDYRSIINNEINNQISRNPEVYFEGDYGFNGIKVNHDYFIENDNLVIQFQHYEIAPYSSGMPSFKIPLTLFKDNIIYDNI